MTTTTQRSKDDPSQRQILIYLIEDEVLISREKTQLVQPTTTTSIVMNTTPTTTTAAATPAPSQSVTPPLPNLPVFTTTPHVLSVLTAMIPLTNNSNINYPMSMKSFFEECSQSSQCFAGLQPSAAGASNAQRRSDEIESTLANNPNASPPLLQQGQSQDTANATAEQKLNVINLDTIRYSLQLLGFKYKDANFFCDILKQSYSNNSTSSLSTEQLEKLRANARVYIRSSQLYKSVVEFATFNKYIRNKETAHKKLLQNFNMCMQILQKKYPLIILLGGTSGTGKSTLSSILASRFQIPTVLSTDSIRHVMRNFMDESDSPILFTSTYEAGKMVENEPTMNESKRTIQGYKIQCKLVQQQLEHVISEYANRNEPMIIEGVHLTPAFMFSMMKKYPYIIPFTICIEKESKHRQRFAVRSKYMTLDKKKNKYIQYIANIRMIQSWHMEKSDMFLIPKINNVNIDKSVNIIHRVVTTYVRKMINDATQMLPERCMNALSLYESFNKVIKPSINEFAINQLPGKHEYNIQKFLEDITKEQEGNQENENIENYLILSPPLLEATPQLSKQRSSANKSVTQTQLIAQSSQPQSQQQLQQTIKETVQHLKVPASPIIPMKVAVSPIISMKVTASPIIPMKVTQSPTKNQQQSDSANTRVIERSPMKPFASLLPPLNLNEEFSLAGGSSAVGLENKPVHLDLALQGNLTSMIDQNKQLGALFESPPIQAIENSQLDNLDVLQEDDDGEFQLDSSLQQPQQMQSLNPVYEIEREANNNISTSNNEDNNNSNNNLVMKSSTRRKKLKKTNKRKHDEQSNMVTIHSSNIDEHATLEQHSEADSLRISGHNYQFDVLSEGKEEEQDNLEERSNSIDDEEEEDDFRGNLDNQSDESSDQGNNKDDDEEDDEEDDEDDYEDDIDEEDDDDSNFDDEYEQEGILDYCIESQQTTIKHLSETNSESIQLGHSNDNVTPTTEADRMKKTVKISPIIIIDPYGPSGTGQNSNSNSRRSHDTSGQSTPHVQFDEQQQYHIQQQLLRDHHNQRSSAGMGHNASSRFKKQASSQNQYKSKSQSLRTVPSGYLENDSKETVTITKSHHTINQAVSTAKKIHRTQSSLIKPSNSNGNLKQHSSSSSSSSQQQQQYQQRQQQRLSSHSGSNKQLNSNNNNKKLLSSSQNLSVAQQHQSSSSPRPLRPSIRVKHFHLAAVTAANTLSNTAELSSALDKPQQADSPA